MGRFQRLMLGGAAALLLAIPVGCSVDGAAPASNEAAGSDSLKASVSAERLTEDRAIYQADRPDEVHDLYITVVRAGTSANKPLVTFEELNHQFTRVEDGEDDPEVQVIIQEGKETSPERGMLGYGEKEANATLQIRGSSTRAADQKSYKIKLNDKAGMWKEQKVLNLNKHAFDLTRVRNKLSFDYFKTIPDFTSLRTSFVHLHVKDLTAQNGPNQEFVDYGLYENIEQPNKTFLKYHGLDPNGNLYKANNFDFQRLPDILKNANDSDYDEKRFENVLKINGNTNHEKLLRMLDDVNDTTKSFHETFSRYFDRDNFLTWMAVNILLDNTDSINQNYMIYSPSGSDKWYFMPWDYDGAWDWHNQGGRNKNLEGGWQAGIANYWSNLVAKRYFQDPKHVELLTAKVEELSKLFTKERTRSMLASYYPVVSKFISKVPDLRQLPEPIETFQAEYDRLPDIPEISKQRYYDTLENPMPIYMGEPERNGEKLSFMWEPSYDLQGDSLTYRFELATDPGFQNTVLDKPGLAATSIEIPAPARGDYYWRVTVQDSKGHKQEAFDVLVDAFNVYHFGVKSFKVE